jgi:hypothetical protein
MVIIFQESLDEDKIYIKIESSVSIFLGTKMIINKDKGVMDYEIVIIKSAFFV